jgi:hypothetical protein
MLTAKRVSTAEGYHALTSNIPTATRVRKNGRKYKSYPTTHAAQKTNISTGSDIKKPGSQL